MVFGTFTRTELRIVCKAFFFISGNCNDNDDDSIVHNGNFPNV